MNLDLMTRLVLFLVLKTSVVSSYQLEAGGDNTSTTFSGVISGDGGLTKEGSGTLELSGKNTHIGATNVQDTVGEWKSF